MRPGERIGDYTIISQIGEGGMSVVYLAERATDAVRVIVKQLKDEYRFNKQLVQRFRREATILRDLRHPHLARVFDVLERDDKQYMIQEYLSGGSLADLLRNQTPYSEEEAIRWCCDALRAMNYAHENVIVHRDLKPSNLMLDEQRKIRVIDFGIARAFGEARLTRTSDASIGTLEYMSPEQIATPQAVDHLTDVYSMGIVLYELLTGAAPFEGPTPFSVQEKIIRQAPPPLKQLGPGVTPLTPNTRAVDPQLAKIVLRAIEKNPARRFGGCAEFSLQLERYLVERAKPPVVGKRTAMIAASVLVLLIVSLLAWSATGGSREEQLRNADDVARQAEIQKATMEKALAEERQAEARRQQEAADARKQQEAVDARKQQEAADARKQQEAADARKQQEIAEARRQQEIAEARKREAAEAERRRDAARRLDEEAMRFFSALIGTWTSKPEDEETEEFRTRTENVLTFGPDCSGVLTRTVTTYKKGFRGWGKVGSEPPTRLTIQCDASGRVSGDLNSRISQQGATLQLGTTIFSRRR